MDRITSTPVMATSQSFGDVPQLLIREGATVIVPGSEAEAKSERLLGRRRDHGSRSRSRAVSALSGERGGEIWNRQQGQGALSVSAGRDVWAHVSTDVGLSGLSARGAAANGRDDPEGQWDPG